MSGSSPHSAIMRSRGTWLPVGRAGILRGGRRRRQQRRDGGREQRTEDAHRCLAIRVEVVVRAPRLTVRRTSQVAARQARAAELEPVRAAGAHLAGGAATQHALAAQDRDAGGGGAPQRGSAAAARGRTPRGRARTSGSSRSRTAAARSPAGGGSARASAAARTAASRRAGARARRRSRRATRARPSARRGGRGAGSRPSPRAGPARAACGRARSSPAPTRAPTCGRSSWPSTWGRAQRSPARPVLERHPRLRRLLADAGLGVVADAAREHLAQRRELRVRELAGVVLGIERLQRALDDVVGRRAAGRRRVLL